MFTIGVPPQFPIVQFPNLPLVVALTTGVAGREVVGPAHPYVVAVSYLAMSIWAYEEATRGANWFRRLLGVTVAFLTLMGVARAIS